MEDILEVKDLKTYYYSKTMTVPAVDGISFSLKRGETVGIVGESGCGKSTAARTIINLLDRSCTRVESGEVLFHGQDLLKLSPKEMNKIRGKKISMIFQNPLTTLNPVFTIGSQIAEVLSLHSHMSKKEIWEQSVKLLDMVGIPSPEERITDYPHQLSGGMQQRVIIAIALACRPEIVIADEPTTALDVTIQSQILNLIKKLQLEFHMSLILITHNMGVVARMCQRIMVMYGGIVVEIGTAMDIFKNPLHPYTRGLLAAIPNTKEDKEELFSIPGFVPKFQYPVTQCRFSNRCPQASERCHSQEPPMFSYESGHSCRCWLYEDGKEGNLNG